MIKAVLLLKSWHQHHDVIISCQKQLCDRFNISYSDTGPFKLLFRYKCAIKELTNVFNLCYGNLVLIRDHYSFLIGRESNRVYLGFKANYLPINDSRHASFDNTTSSHIVECDTLPIENHHLTFGIVFPQTLIFKLSLVLVNLV